MIEGNEVRGYIGEAGFYAYSRNSDVAVAIGMIGPAEHRLRQSYLRDLLSPTAKAHMHFPWEDCEPEPEDELEGLGQGDAPDPCILVDSDGSDVSERGFLTDPADPNRVLRLLTPVSPKSRTKWYVHQADADFFPSVPHGHGASQANLKLDVYRGFVYDVSKNNRNTAREPRAFIVQLWNDQRFRALAHNAVAHFIAENPRFDWKKQRGIGNPLKFPQYRK